MKKYTLAILVLFIIVGASVPKSVYAVNSADTSVMMEKKSTASADTAKDGAEQKKAEYALPYPGILADHPLYFLKKLRDSILEKLISDPTKKVEFYILQADKQLNAGIFLEAKGNAKLAVTMFGEEVNFMKQAVTSANMYKSQGKAVPQYVIEKLNMSITKHLELLAEHVQEVGESQAGEMKTIVETMNTLQNDAAGLQE